MAEGYSTQLLVVSSWADAVMERITNQVPADNDLPCVVLTLLQQGAGSGADPMAERRALDL